MSKRNAKKRVNTVIVPSPTPVEAAPTAPPEVIQLEAGLGLSRALSLTKIALGNSRAEALQERFARRKAECEKELQEINEQIANELRMTGEEQEILVGLLQKIEQRHGIKLSEYGFETECVLRRKPPANERS